MPPWACIICLFLLVYTKVFTAISTSSMSSRNCIKSVIYLNSCPLNIFPFYDQFFSRAPYDEINLVVAKVRRILQKILFDRTHDIAKELRAITILFDINRNDNDNNRTYPFDRYERDWNDVAKKVRRTTMIDQVDCRKFSLVHARQKL